MLKKKITANYIEKIQDSTGKMVYNTSLIPKNFQEYYSKLYAINKNETNEQKNKRREKMRAFLEGTDLNRISEEQGKGLEESVTEDEIRKILRETPFGKSPGPDGLTALYYKKFGDILVPKLCSYINGIGTKWAIRKEALEVAITIIPKEGKDTTLCVNYRPISLLNDDIKLFAKVMAGRLKPLMSELIHTDQGGFVSGREC